MSVLYCHKEDVNVRFQAVNTKMAVFWDDAPCSLVEVYRRFRDAESSPW
jgi:hypothetical protein